MAFADASTWIGILSSVALLSIILLRQKRFELDDLGSLALIFLAGTNLLPAAYITYFGANSSLNVSLPLELRGYEKFLALAGLCSFFISCVTLWSYGKKAWSR